MFSKSTGAILFSTFAIVALAGAAQQGVLLRRQLKADSKEVYKIESEAKQNMSMPQGDQDLDVKAQVTYTLTTKTVDAAKGEADVESLTKTDKLDFSGSLASMMPAQDGKIPDVTVQGKLDTRNRLVAKSLPKMNAMAAMMSTSNEAMRSAMFIVLPEKEVKVGDSWDVVLPKTPFTGDVENKLTAKLTGEKTVDGKKFWVVSVTGQIKTETDSTKMAAVMDGAGGAGLPDVSIKGTADISGEGLVDESTGQTYSMDTTMKNKSAVDVGGMVIDVTGTGTMKIKIVK